jgi:hypothetical protein
MCIYTIGKDNTTTTEHAACVCTAALEKFYKDTVLGTSSENITAVLLYTRFPQTPRSLVNV